MAIFDHLRLLIEQTPENAKALVVCVPRPNSTLTMNFADASRVTFHDDLGILESRGPSDSLFFHVADLQRITVLHITGSVGEAVAREMPDAWARVNEQGREALNSTFFL